MLPQKSSKWAIPAEGKRKSRSSSTAGSDTTTVIWTYTLLTVNGLYKRNLKNFQFTNADGHDARLQCTAESYEPQLQLLRYISWYTSRCTCVHVQRIYHWVF